MSDDLDEVVENVKSGSTWIRILYMVGYFVVLYVVAVVLVFLVAAQALFSLFAGGDNRNLRLLGLNLAEYVNQIMRFLTFNSEHHPFPFNAFPRLNEVDESATAAATDNADSDTGQEKTEKVTQPAAEENAGSAGNTAPDKSEIEGKPAAANKTRSASRKTASGAAKKIARKKAATPRKKAASSKAGKSGSGDSPAKAEKGS
jgi:hypothetical protein